MVGQRFTIQITVRFLKCHLRSHGFRQIYHRRYQPAFCRIIRIVIVSRCFPAILFRVRPYIVDALHRNVLNGKTTFITQQAFIQVSACHSHISFFGFFESSGTGRINLRCTPAGIVRIFRYSHCSVGICTVNHGSLITFRGKRELLNQIDGEYIGRPRYIVGTQFGIHSRVGNHNIRIFIRIFAPCTFTIYIEGSGIGVCARCTAHLQHLGCYFRFGHFLEKAYIPVLSVYNRQILDFGGRRTLVSALVSECQGNLFPCKLRQVYALSDEIPTVKSRTIIS